MRSSSASDHGVPTTSSFAKRPPARDDRLPQISIFIVPLKGGTIWPLDRIAWHSNRHSVQSSVLFSVVEYVSHSVAHNEMEISINRGIASVEDAMNVLAKQYSIGLGMRPSFSIGTNMGSI